MQAVAVWQGDRLAARQEAVLRGMWARQHGNEEAMTANVALPVSRYDLEMVALAVCRGYVQAHTTEQGGNNCGTQVAVFQRAAGGDPREAWCLDYQQTCDLKALANKLPRPYTAATFVSVCLGLHQTLALYHAVTSSCGELMRDGIARDHWIDRDKITEIRAGWRILYAFSAKDIAGRVPRHVGRCNADWKRSTLPVASLEGNTPPDDGDQAGAGGGDGCYLKHRSFGNIVGVYATYTPGEATPALATPLISQTNGRVAFAIPQSCDAQKTD